MSVLYERDKLLADLRKNVIGVSFTKVNGEDRVMKCTLRPDLLPASYVTEEKEEGEFHKKNPDILAVWDVDKQGWRSFRIDSVTYVDDINERY